MDHAVYHQVAAVACVPSGPLGTWIPCFVLLSGAGGIEAEAGPPEVPGEPQGRFLSSGHTCIEQELPGSSWLAMDTMKGDERSLGAERSGQRFQGDTLLCYLVPWASCSWEYQSPLPGCQVPGSLTFCLLTGSMSQSLSSARHQPAARPARIPPSPCLYSPGPI